MHEIERPLLVRRGVDPQRSTCTHAVLALLAAQSQAGFAINPMNPFMVHMLAFTAQQHMQSTVTITRLLPRQFQQPFAQPLVGIARLIAIARHRNQQQSARTALAEGILVRGGAKIDHEAARERRYVAEQK